MKIIDIARICHQANKEYCESLGDFTQDNWHDADEGIVRSAVDGVENAIANDYTPRESHESWCRFKIANGWVYGIVKNLHMKTHPLLVDYDHLSKENKVKDELFITIVNIFKPFLDSK